MIWELSLFVKACANGICSCSDRYAVESFERPRESMCGDSMVLALDWSFLTSSLGFFRDGSHWCGLSGSRRVRPRVSCSISILWTFVCWNSAPNIESVFENPKEIQSREGSTTCAGLPALLVWTVGHFSSTLCGKYRHYWHTVGWMNPMDIDSREGWGGWENCLRCIGFKLGFGFLLGHPGVEDVWEVLCLFFPCLDRGSKLGFVWFTLIGFLFMW